jgi:hypothetical protein
MSLTHLPSIILRSQPNIIDPSTEIPYHIEKPTHPYTHHNELLNHSHDHFHGHGLGVVVILDARRIGSANGPYRPLQTIHRQPLSHSRRVSPGHLNKIILPSANTSPTHLVSTRLRQDTPSSRYSASAARSPRWTTCFTRRGR